MADENIVIGVDLKDDFTAPARKVVKSLDDMGDSASSADKRFRLTSDSIEDVGDESTVTAGKARLASRRIREMGNEALKTAGKMKVLSAAMSRLDRINRSTGGGAGGASPGGRGGSGDPTGKIVKAGFQLRGLRLAGIIAAIASIIPAAVAAVSSLGAAIMGLAGALGPLTGLIVAYPGYLAAFGQAFAAVKLSLSGLGEAIKTNLDPAATSRELQAAYNSFSGMSREFRSEFVRNLSVAKREIDGMKGAIQQALLPSINNLVSATRTLFPTIATGLASTGAAISGVVNRFASIIQSGAFTQELNTIMGNNNQIISSFGDAAIFGFRALMDVLVAAGPLLKQIASDIKGLFQNLSDTMAVSSAGGGLTDFFQKTYDVARQVVQIFWDVGMALKNIATIGQPLGQAILNSFSAIAEAFRSFTESGDGVNQIRQWFIDMTPVIYEIGFLIRDVVQALFGLSNPTQFLQISIALRQELLPVLVSVIEHFSQLLPAIIQIATAALEMFNAFQEMAPIEVIFSGFATVLSVIARAITAIASGPLSGIGTAIMFMVGAAAGVKILAAAFLFLARAVVGSAIMAAIRGLIASVRMFGFTSTATAASVRALGLAIRGALITTGIGAIIVVIGLVVEAMMSMNAAVDEQIAANEAWAESLFDVNGALTENSNAQTANTIAGKDYIGALESMGIYTADVVDAVMGSDQSWQSLEDRLRGVIEAGTSYVRQGRHVVVTTTDQADAAQRALDDLTGMRNGFIEVEEKARRTSEALGEGATAMDELALSTQSATNSLQKLTGWLDTLGSNASWRQSIMSLNEALKEGTSFKKWTEEGEQNLSNLRGAVEQSLEKVKTLYEGGNVKGAERVLQKRIAMLKDIMLELPKEDRKPFQQMLDRLMTQRRRFDRQLAATVNKPIVIGPTVTGAATGLGAEGPKQSMPNQNIPQTVQVDTSQVDAAQTKTNTLQTTLDTLTGTKHNITLSYNSLSMAVVKAQTLTRELIALTSKPWIVNVEYRETGKRAHGGPVTSGRIYTVGELGPEAFIGKSGNMTMIGVNGQQQKTFSEDGWVVPNSQLATAMAGMASDGAPQSREYQIGGTSPVINIGTINASNEIDVIKAVKKGIAEAERNRRERS
jgi:hypothetical protein